MLLKIDKLYFFFNILFKSKKNIPLDVNYFRNPKLNLIMRFFFSVIVLFLFFCADIFAQPLAAHQKNISAQNYKAAANSALDLGDFYKSSKNFEKARNYFNDAIAFGKKSGNYEAAGEASYKLALMEVMSNKKAGIRYLQEARGFYTRAGDYAGIAVVSYAAAVMLSDNKSPENLVVSAYKEALDASVKVANYKIALTCADILKKKYADSGNKGMALFYGKYYDDLYKLANPNAKREYTAGNNNRKIKEELALENLSDSLKILQSKYESLDKKRIASFDSILNVKRLQETQLQHTMDSLEIVDAKYKTEKAEKKSLEERSQLMLYIYLVSGFFVLLTVIILAVAYTQKRKANHILAAMNSEITEQKALIEQEKTKADNLLLNILPEETAAELKEKGYATPMQYEKVSVLFTDFKGFTQMSEILSPAQIIEELNRCFIAFDEICEKYDLEKIKTIGDAYMCAGGIPVANESNPRDVVMAGLEMMEFMEKLKQEKKERGEMYFEARLGINTGAVITGVVGKKKFAYDLWGDTVNLASRMESSGEVGKVNISGNTYEYIKDDFICSYRGKVTAKGKGEVDMYFVEKKSF